MSDEATHNYPISERFRIVAKQWVEADEAASLLEETRTPVLSEMIGRVIGSNISMPFNKAELAAKSSDEYKEFITNMVQLRSKANLLKVQMEYLRMQFQEHSSHEANARAEKRL
jgi:response regulator RpfG family c-di-GMP phosphodiesterase